MAILGGSILWVNATVVAGLGIMSAAFGQVSLELGVNEGRNGVHGKERPPWDIDGHGVKPPMMDVSSSISYELDSPYLVDK